MKRKLISVIMSLLLISSVFTACGHEHTWEEATCTDPKTCSTCGETEGRRLGHEYSEATCTEPQTCENCGKTKGEALGHDWSEATCTEPATCARCGETQGEPGEHLWSEGSCAQPSVCTVCGAAGEETYDHVFSSPNYQNGGVCAICGAVGGDPVQGSFETYGIAMDIVDSEIFEYQTVCKNDNSKNTVGAAMFTYCGATTDTEDLKGTAEYLFETYGSCIDFNSYLKEGYIWQVVVYSTSFADDNYQRYGVSTAFLREDYFDPASRDNSDVQISKTDNLWQYTVNFNGVNCEECLYTRASTSYIENGVYTETGYCAFMVPIGYDGTVTGVISDGVDWPAGKYIYDLDLTSAHFMRLPAAVE